LLLQFGKNALMTVSALSSFGRQTSRSEKHNREDRFGFDQASAELSQLAHP
jgi:hypothetical protein